MASVFGKIKYITPYSNITIERGIEIIENNPQKDQILNARTYLRDGNVSKYTEIKYNLPYITWAGNFTKRSLDNLITLSGYIYFDIDEEIDPYQLIQQFDFIKYSWKSLSNKGVGFLVKVDDLTVENFKDNYHFIKDLLFEKGVKVDCLDDFSRANILSYSQVFKNENAIVFSAIDHYDKYRDTLTKIETNDIVLDLDENVDEETILRIALGHAVKWLRATNRYYEDGTRHNFLLTFFGTVISKSNIEKEKAIEFLKLNNYWLIDVLIPDDDWEQRAVKGIENFYKKFKK